MNLATKITCVRLVLIPVGVALLFLDAVPHHYVWATVIYVVAALTDLVDGWVARRFGMVTAGGGSLDAIADKLLMLTYFAYLQSVGVYPLWLFELMLVRSVLITFTRRDTGVKGLHPVSVIFAKLHTALVMASLTLGLVAVLAATQEISADANLLQAAAYWTMLAGLVAGVVVPPRDIARTARMMVHG